MGDPAGRQLRAIALANGGGNVLDKRRNEEADWYVGVTFWFALAACLVGGASIFVALIN
jgi:hypothetical protein